MGIPILTPTWLVLRVLPAGLAYRIVHSTPESLARVAAKLEGRPVYPGRERILVKGLGVEVDNLLGIAAGFDKDAKLAWLAWALGAGFHVIGSVLPHPHTGANRKVVARLGNATVNRLGLPSEGATRVASRLAKSKPPSLPIAISVASLDVEGYSLATSTLAPHADWIEVNISCPNTAEHRSFEDPDLALKACQEAYRAAGGKPILLKLPPLKSRDATWTYADIARECGASGVVASNTLRIRYRGVEAGMGGAPLYPIVKSMVSWLRERLPEDSIVVTVGGIDNEDKALELLDLGANLIEVISALLLHGPARFRKIARATREWALRNL